MRKLSIAVLVVVILVIVFFAYFHTRQPVYTRQQFHTQQQSITGIGVELAMRHGELEVMDVLPNTPAAQAGLHRGLIIQQINRTNVDGLPLVTCVAMTRGPVGSTVQLKVIDPTNSETSIVDFTREKIALPAGHGQIKAKPAAN